VGKLYQSEQIERS